LSGTAVKRSPGRLKRTQSVIKTVAAEPTKRGMSAEGRAKVAAAQKLRPPLQLRKYLPFPYLSHKRLGKVGAFAALIIRIGVEVSWAIPGSSQGNQP
jgi:hypothetical protein